MPQPLTADIISFHQASYLYSTYLQNLRNDMLDLATQLTAEGCPNSANSASNMAVHIWEMRNHFAYGANSVRYWLVKCLQYIDGNAFDGVTPDPYELTMDKILTTIWDSDKLRWFHFINYIDSMRAGIWNVEIYDKHLEEWYRHFSA